MRVLAFVLCCSGAALPAQLSSRGTVTGVHVDSSRGDASIWIVGDNYKASFDARGACFVPDFGPDASRTWPLRLTPVGPAGAAATPRCTEAGRITYQRGGVQEIWDLDTRSMRQSFVLQDRPQGPVVVEIDVVTDLDYSEQRVDGSLVFAGPDGSLSYGLATAIDATGARTTFAPRFLDGSIVLEVPTDFALHAVYPLVIDPVVKNLNIATTVDRESEPSVAYSPRQDRWAIVYERQFSRTDRDVFVALLNGSGQSIGLFPVATTLDDEVSPGAAVASGTASVDRFVFGWIERPVTQNFPAVVKARQLEANSTTLSSQTIVEAFTGTGGLRPTAVVLGGSVVTNRTHGRCVVAYELESTLNRELRAKILTTNTNAGSVGSVIFKEKSPGCRPKLAVNKCSAQSERWVLSWGKTGLAPLCRDGNIHFACISGDGFVVKASTQLGQGRLEHSPSVAGDGDRFFVSWIGDANGTAHVFGSYLTVDANNAFRVRLTRDLSSIEPGGNSGIDHETPVVDFDGCRFACAYLEASKRASAMTFGMTTDASALLFSEGRAALGVASSAIQSSPSIATRGIGGQPPGTFLVAWHTLEQNQNLEIKGAFYEARGTGATRVVRAACSASPPGLVSATAPALGQRFSIAMKGATGAPLMLFGLDRGVAPLCVTKSGTCAVMADILSIHAGPTFAVPIPCDIRLVGQQFAMQGLDVFAGDGCSPALFGFAFRLTDMHVITVQ